MHKIQMHLQYTLVGYAIKKCMTMIKLFYVKVDAIFGFTGEIKSTYSIRIIKLFIFS